MPHTTDIDLTDRDISGLTSVDALMSLFGRLGYETDARKVLSPAWAGLADVAADPIKKIELISQDSEVGGPYLLVVFVQAKSLTARLRTHLVRALGNKTVDHLLVLTTDFETLEFVLIDKPKTERRGPGTTTRRQPIPRTVAVNRRRSTPANRRTLRRLTWTAQDAIDQFAKLKSAFHAAAFASDYFQNRNLFADYYLEHRLREDRVWRDNPSEAFSAVTTVLRDWDKVRSGPGKQDIDARLYQPLWRHLGFQAAASSSTASEPARSPDYELRDAVGRMLTAVYAYPWDRWLDGPDSNDPGTPEENPAACVISALDSGGPDWIVVTNGKQWRLYSRYAHARATHFYEVDLVEALAASGDTDPNEAFRYWWLFFRPDAFRPAGYADAGCWLDAILRGSRDFARKLGENLKDRIFYHVFRDLAAGFLADRRGRLGRAGDPTRQELDIVFEATLTLLYRLLFLLYAESRDLLPVGEPAYFSGSLKKLKEEIAEKAGVARDAVAKRLEQAYSATGTGLYERLGELFAVMDKGNASLNVPTYNGGLFNTSPADSDGREQRIAQFLRDHRVPDLQLALAIDSLARDQDERTLGLVPIDYKSLEVRHLGSIYEGLLEFKLIVADEDKAIQAEKGREKYTPLARVQGRRGRQAEVAVRKGEVYLSNDKADRKASGSYYTPDPIVEYIVAQTVGPVLDEKLEALRVDFRKVRKTFDNELQKAAAYPPPASTGRTGRRSAASRSRRRTARTRTWSSGCSTSR